ncbi:hypothetical protein [Methylobacterium sp. R2-1]|uniref:hypothetical protein n=1 Tax=Methylobacterium sp. R2-1 TaxID=2587064 RepID=UPI00185DF556|nr:hypothetical protein [Methylobacterium sp. R2-1]MBB2964938.1 hypothetical protein [Methylobacterium sp. R2-1]
MALSTDDQSVEAEAQGILEEVGRGMRNDEQEARRAGRSLQGPEIGRVSSRKEARSDDDEIGFQWQSKMIDEFRCPGDIDDNHPARTNLQSLPQSDAKALLVICDNDPPHNYASTPLAAINILESPNFLEDLIPSEREPGLSFSKGQQRRRTTPSNKRPTDLNYNDACDRRSAASQQSSKPLTLSMPVASCKFLSRDYPI